MTTSRGMNSDVCFLAAALKMLREKSHVPQRLKPSFGKRALDAAPKRCCNQNRYSINNHHSIPNCYSAPSFRKLVVGLAMMIVAAIPALAADFAVLNNGFSIRHEHREVIGSVTRLYLNVDDKGFVDVPTSNIDHFETDNSPQPVAPIPVQASSGAASPVRLDQVVATVGERQNIDPDLINSVIHAESGFNPHAVSPKGARGLMQLMPQTASKLGVANSFDPQANVDGGTRYLRMLLERYNFDLVKALAAYNAGPQRVEQYRGVPPYYETRAYVARIIRDFNRKKLAEQKAAAAAAKNSKPKPQIRASVKQAALPSHTQVAVR